MKFHSILEEVFGKKSNIAIIRVLAEKDLELTGRQIAQLAGLNHRTCQLSLRELAIGGFVTFRKVGRSNLFKLKRENMFVKEGVLYLLELEGNLLNKVQLLITKKLGTKDTLSLILFGSVALAKEKPESDMDVCVIVKNEKGKTFVEREEESLNQTTIKLFGNQLAFYPLTVSEFKKRFAKGDKLVEEIFQTGKVFWGKSLKEIVKHGWKK